MSRFKLAYRAIVILIVVGSLGLAAGWISTTSCSFSENVALADTAKSLQKAPIKIVYLTAGSIPEINDAARSGNVATLNDPSLAEKRDAAVPLDALVFDASLKGSLDQQWLRDRYRQGMAIAGIDVSIK